MEQNKETSILKDTLECNGCGAKLNYSPGSDYLKCEYCGSTDNPIPQAKEYSISTYNYDEFVKESRSVGGKNNQELIKCNSCGSKTVFEKNQTATQCPFCTAPLVIEMVNSEMYVKPHYVLPFVFGKDDAVKHLQKWIKGLWFAPNGLAKAINSGSLSPLKGIYLPYWLYDSDTSSSYSGERGEYYYVNESYTERVNGKDVSRTRRVRKTQWQSVSGTVNCPFEDITITATQSLPKDFLDALTPWSLDKLKPFDERYISGFNSETFQISPETGFVEAQSIMNDAIKEAIRKDIGGDEQRISSCNVEYYNIGIKYVLLPVWVSSFKYNNKIYQFIVNASTGEVKGKRPYSTMKIVILVAIILSAILYFYLNQGNT